VLPYQVNPLNNNDARDCTTARETELAQEHIEAVRHDVHPRIEVDALKEETESHYKH
jgi:hypothetical protein